MRSLIVLCVIFFLSHAQNPEYDVGTGIWDITGPAAEVGMMGYAQPSQVSAGIHFRLRARAFIVVEKAKNTRMAYVNLDICFTTVWVKKAVIEQLNTKLPGLYNYDNVLITSTHTHSGPAGYSWYTIYDITSFGYKKENLDTIVNGIVNAILMAHNNLKPGNIYINSGDLVNPQTNINRSPSAYLNNPSSERAKYPYNVDKGMVTLKLEYEDGTPVGAITWYAVHGTSMTNQNLLISGDNKGYASYAFEMQMNGDNLPGTGPFVAAFSNCNEGDVSPNTKGAFCDNGTPCDFDHSTCNGYSETCHGYGPGKNEFESTKIIGTQQFQKSLELFQSATTKITGSLDFRHTFVNMENVTVNSTYSGLNYPVTTCVAALGDSMAAGTTDGPGDFDFKQGSNSTKDNPYWNLIANFISEPPQDQIKCHFPKPILLYTGGINFPTKWTPNILPIQLVKLGKLYIIAVPAEFTTMSGRRLRDTVKSVLVANGAPSDITIVISGLANAYSQYCATREEYDIQRYEGASTLFGPYTLNAYQQLFAQLAEDLATGKPTPPGPMPTDFSNEIIDILPGVVFDDGPIGTLLQDVNSTYTVGQTVTAIFYSADPRNNYRTQGTFLTVEKQNSDGTWKVIATDGNWETKFKWQRHYNIDLGESYATIEWDIPQNAAPGKYRIQHFGDRKYITGEIVPFVGTSSTFVVSS